MSPGTTTPLAVLLAVAVSTPQGTSNQSRSPARLPLEVDFVDEHGERRTLASFLGGGGDGAGRDEGAVDLGAEAPVTLLVPGWFRCETLCAVLVPRLRSRLEELRGWEPETDYRVLLVSIDPGEGPEDAAARRRQALQGVDGGWHLLTGDEDAISALSEAIGFWHRRDGSDGFVHAAMVVGVAADGTVASYLHGADPSTSSVRGVLEAARRTGPSGALERFLVVGLRHVPALRGHADTIESLLRLCGATLLIALALLLTTAARRAVDDIEGLQ